MKSCTISGYVTLSMCACKGERERDRDQYNRLDCIVLRILILTCTSVFGRAMISQVYGAMKVQESKVRGGAIETRCGDAF